jgi:hypothetical protein
MRNSLLSDMPELRRLRLKNACLSRRNSKIIQDVLQMAARVFQLELENRVSFSFAPKLLPA